MTTDELYNEFNLYYNNLTSNQAAGLDRYEISVYLTKAQLALLDGLYSEFETSENVRRKLAPLVTTVKLQPKVVSVNEIVYPEYTTTFDTVDNIRWIIHENVKMSNSANRCIKGQFLKVRPCLHDELDTIINNPYRFNLKRALRLDTSTSGKPYIEILTKDNHIEYYQIRYVKTPEPIMLYTVPDTDSIDGFEPTDEPRGASLDESCHRQIVEYAAKMAYQDYKV